MVLIDPSLPSHGHLAAAITDDVPAVENPKVETPGPEQQPSPAPHAPSRSSPLLGRITTGTIAPEEAIATDDEMLIKDVKAFIGTLPEADSEAFMEVHHRDAGLIARESDPALFLRLHNGSVADAALAVALYWKERKAAFASDDRYVLPMDLTGQGAMTPQDARAVVEGAVRRLPADREGRSALWFNLFRLQGPAVSSEARRRAFLYLLHASLTNDGDDQTTTMKGYGIVCFLNASHGPLLSEIPIELYERVLGSPPTAIHVVLNLQGTETSSDDVLETLEPYLSRIAGEDLEDRLFFHRYKEGVKVPPASLLSAGFQATGLPTCIGGVLSDTSSTDRLVTKGGVKRTRTRETVLSPVEDSDDEIRFSPASKRPKLSTVHPKSVKVTSFDSRKPSVSRSSKNKSDARKAAGPNREPEIDRAALALPDDQRLAYEEAKELAPHLVNKETDPMDFLAAEQGDVESAAARLVANWNLRKELFSGRAFFPLTQTGEGALNRPDLTALSTGVFLVLPTDNKGRSVLYFDCAKIGDSTRDSLRRLAFYMFSVACEMSASPDRGIVVLVSLQNGVDSANFRVCFSDIIDAMPGQVVSYHVICFQALNQNPNSPKEHLGEVATAYFGSVPELKFFVHMDRTRSQALEILRMYGLSVPSLPKAIGGSWGVERFVEWCELRTRFEWGLPPAASHKGVEKVFDFSHIKPPSMLNEDDRIERARRMNVLHSRRKRERERIEIEVLHEQCDEMRTLQTELLQDSSRLEALLATAQSIVANPPPESGYGMLVGSTSSTSQVDGPPSRSFVTMGAPAFVSNDSSGQPQSNEQQRQQHTGVGRPESAAFYPHGQYVANASGQVVVQAGQPFVPQGQANVQPTRASAPQGQFIIAAPSAPQPFCLMPNSGAQGVQVGAGYTVQQLPMQGMPQQQIQGIPQQQVVPYVEVQYQQAPTQYLMQVNGGLTPLGFLQSPGPAPMGFAHAPGPAQVGFVQPPGPAPVGFVQSTGASYSVPVPVMTTSASDFVPFYTTTAPPTTAPTMMSDDSSQANSAPSGSLVQAFP